MEPALVTTNGNGSNSAQAPWDRRGGLERRRGERRLRSEPVLFERRGESRRDASRRRRLHRAIDVEPRSDRSKRLHAILSQTLLSDRPALRDSQFRVVVKEGLVASVYSAWERANPQADGGLYRRIEGEYHRRIGSRLQDVDAFPSVEDAERAYEVEYQRAYRIIYAEHPDLRGVGEEVDGEIVRR